jgi:hypothetical protein
MTFDGSALTVSNNNTAGYQVFITQAGTGDSAVQYRVAGPIYWTTGIDNSDSDAYVIANSTDLGTTNYLRLGGSAITFSQNVNGFTMAGNLDMGNNDITSAGTIQAVTLNAEEKNFDIPHPTKEGWRLRYSVLEGPERGVYVRGHLSGSNTIELPDYWSGLVYEDSISVQLTPVGSPCTHYVDTVTTASITVGCQCGEVNAYYIIHAERKAEEPVWVEYQIKQ